MVWIISDHQKYVNHEKLKFSCLLQRSMTEYGRDNHIKVFIETFLQT